MLIESETESEMGNIHMDFSAECECAGIDQINKQGSVHDRKIEQLGMRIVLNRRVKDEPQQRLRNSFHNLIINTAQIK